MRHDSDIVRLWKAVFQSTHSLRSATGAFNFWNNKTIVSIHALLAECDSKSSVAGKTLSGFNPRTPCGVRRNNPQTTKHYIKFQSTHSLRSATEQPPEMRTLYKVSIHALLAECDLTPAEAEIYGAGFNPRTPCGVRRIHIASTRAHAMFQSTHSLRSATGSKASLIIRCRVSIHALLAECDHRILSYRFLFPGFNPRTPCGVRRGQPHNNKLKERFQSTHSLRSATQPTLYITTQQSKSYFAPTSLKRPSLHGYTF